MMKTISGVLLLLPVLLAVGLSQTPTPTPPIFPSEAQVREAEAAFQSIEEAPMSVSGVMQDDAGNPVSGVSLEIDRFETDDVEGGGVREYRTLDASSFDLRFQSCRGLTLTFSKQGYYDAQIKLELDDVPADALIRNQTLHLQRIVLLEKAKDLPKLQKEIGSIKIQREGEALVWKVSASSFRDGARRLANNDLEMGYPYCYLDIEVAEEYDEVVKELEDENGSRYRLWYPADRRYSIGIRGGAPGDGLILHKPVGVQERYMYSAFDSMAMAPDTGYSPRITFTQEEILGALDRTPLYLYFKAGGGYGKLKFRVRALKPERFQAYVEMCYQPNGDRNLETRGADR